LKPHITDVLPRNVYYWNVVLFAIYITYSHVFVNTSSIYLYLFVLEILIYTVNIECQLKQCMSVKPTKAVDRANPEL